MDFGQWVSRGVEAASAEAQCLAQDENSIFSRVPVKRFTFLTQYAALLYSSLSLKKESVAHDPHSYSRFSVSQRLSYNEMDCELLTKMAIDDQDVTAAAAAAAPLVWRCVVQKKTIVCAHHKPVLL